jgi:hypothetical protein
MKHSSSSKEGVMGKAETEVKAQVGVQSPRYPSAHGADSVARHVVVQGILDLFEQPSYLEIGVFKGVTFNRLKAARKVGVDPKFAFDFSPIAAADASIEFWQVTSDCYFGTVADPSRLFDVVYLDGLHTFEQTLRDLLNAMSLIKSDGVIVIDDVFPSSYVASLPSLEAFKQVRIASGVQSRDWMGDVYRLIFFISSFCQQYDHRTINDNHGQLVLWRGARAEVEALRVADIATLGYDQLLLRKQTLRLAPYCEVLDTLKLRGRSKTQP